MIQSNFDICGNCEYEQMIDSFDYETGESHQFCPFCGYTYAHRVKFWTDWKPLFMKDSDWYEWLEYETTEILNPYCAYSLTYDGVEAKISWWLRSKEDLMSLVWKIKSDPNISDMKFSFNLWEWKRKVFTTINNLLNYVW